MLNDVEHFFMCFWVTMSSLDKCVFRSSTYFLIALFAFLILSCISKLVVYFGD